MIDLFRPFLAPEVKERVARVLTPDADGRIYCGQGPQVEAFEAALQVLLGTDLPPLTVNSCTSALTLALHLIGVGPGDEVVTTPMTCTATNAPIVTRGGTPVWADVDPLTGLIDSADAGRKITKRTKAIMAVDWGGRVCDYAALRQFGIPVIQDAAHSLTAGIGGDYACFSFGPIKQLTTGDGGALLCLPDQMERARLLRWYGLDRRSKADFRCEQDIAEVGYKMHLNDINAAIGLANLPYVAGNIARCRDNAAWYDGFLKGTPGLALPPPDPASAWWLYCVLVEDAPGLIAFLRERGIAASPVHRRNDVHPALHFPNGALPGVDRFASREVAVPVGAWLTMHDRYIVASAVREWGMR